MRKALVFWTVLTLSSVAHAAAGAKADQGPVVLSMSTVGDFSVKIDSKAGLSLRPQIVTRVVREYDCVTLSRSSCDRLATEGELQRFKSIDDPDADVGMVLAADYALRIYLVPSDKAGVITVIISAKDLRDNVDKQPTRIAWDVPVKRLQGIPGERSHERATRDYSQVAKTIVEKIAKALSLSRRAQTDVDASNPTARDRETWAVLPFARLDRASTASQSNMRAILSTHVLSEVMLPTYKRHYLIRDGIKSPSAKSLDKNAARIAKKAQLVASERELELKKNGNAVSWGDHEFAVAGEHALGGRSQEKRRNDHSCGENKTG